MARLGSGSYDPYTTTKDARTITKLDALGRVVETERASSASPVVVRRKVGYDEHGQPAFTTDGTRESALRRFDVLGREQFFVLGDGTRGFTEWNAWGEVLASRMFGANGAPLSSTRNIFTSKGRLRASNDEIDAGVRSRQTRFSWDDGDKTTTTRVGEIGSIADDKLSASGTYRATESVRDPAGRVTDERTGEAGGFSGPMTAVWSRRNMNYVGHLPFATYTHDRVGASYTSTVVFDGLERPTTITEAGDYATLIEYDEAGNALWVRSPGMNPETALFDSRGLPLTATLPDGKTLQMEYDERGALRKRTDEGGEATTYTPDALGRTTRIDYPDGTSEEIRYEDVTGTVLARRDRAGKWISTTYGVGGRVVSLHDGEDPATAPILIAYDYHADGRLHRVRNAEAAIEYEQYDLLGRPGITRSIRYTGSSGVSGTPQVAEVYTQRHAWSIHDGERSSWTMPAIGLTVPADDPTSPWLQTIVETRDAGANLIRQETPFGLLSEAFGRAVGRISWRKHSTGLATIATEFGYDDGVTPPTDVEIPAPIVASGGNDSGLPLWSRTTVGTEQRSGSGIARDAAKRVGALRDLGLEDRLSSWTYDKKGRLEKSWLQLRASTPANTPATALEALTPPDFREARTTASQFTSSQASLLGDTILRIEPPSWTATESAGHQIDARTMFLAGNPQPLRDYAFSGGRRTKDGDWTYTFNALGRMTTAESVAAGRRIAYQWDPNDRLIGRTAYEPDTNGWKLETRTTVLARDGLPADATFVWDPLVDRLVAVFARGGGVVRQYLHGDRGYDDPIEVRIATTPGGTPTRYFPAIDHTGTGSLQAVLDVNGNLVERVLYGDSYGDGPRYLQGAVADKIEIYAKKAANGDLEQITISAHLSEKVVPSSIPNGAVVRSVKSDRTEAYTLTTDPQLVDEATLVWTLTPADWTALSTASGAEALEVRITNTLRAEGWGQASVTPMPDWAEKIYGYKPSPDAPVIIREQLTTTSAWINGITTDDRRSLFEIPSLYAAASEEPRAKVLFDFQGLPFSEPATGLIYARARWYDPQTGTFLTPDPIGYQDSSNLYAFAAGDPVNNADPTGKCLGLDSIDCTDYAFDAVMQFADPRNNWGNVQRSARFLGFEVKGAAYALPRAIAGAYHVATHLAETVEGVKSLATAIATNPGAVARQAGNAMVNSDPDHVAEIVGDVLFFAGAGAAVKTPQVANALSKARTVTRVVGSGAADATAGLRVTPLSRNVHRYLNEIQQHTGIRVSKRQRSLLAEALREKSFSRLPTTDIAIARRAFDKAKGDLILEWQRQTATPWPTYAADVYSKSGRRLRRAGQPYDAHHIIELNYGGPDRWWNIHPARFPDQHQAGIHVGVSRKLFE